MTQLRNHGAWRVALLPFAFVGLVTACGTSSDSVADTIADEVATTVAAAATTVAADVGSTDEDPCFGRHF